MDFVWAARDGAEVVKVIVDLDALLDAVVKSALCAKSGLDVVAGLVEVRAPSGARLSPMQSLRAQGIVSETILTLHVLKKAAAAPAS